MDGRLYTLLRNDALDSRASGLFLTHLRPHGAEKLLVSWDGSPIHRGQVRTCLAAGGARQMQVEQLPPDAPALNPGEGVWHPLQPLVMRHLCGLNRVHLRCERGRAIKRLRRKPQVMNAGCAQAGLSLDT
jgi:hypothetical protein